MASRPDVSLKSWRRDLIDGAGWVESWSGADGYEFSEE